MEVEPSFVPPLDVRPPLRAPIPTPTTSEAPSVQVPLGGKAAPQTTTEAPIPNRVRYPTSPSARFCTQQCLAPTQESDETRNDAFRARSQRSCRRSVSTGACISSTNQSITHSMRDPLTPPCKHLLTFYNLSLSLKPVGFRRVDEQTKV